jgi:hypothetical protein
MKEELSLIADNVVDETSFLRFLKALADDWNDEQAKEILHPSSPYGPGANGWENVTIGNFLEAMIAWAHANPAEDTGLAGPASGGIWKRVAHIVLAGKFYE